MAVFVNRGFRRFFGLSLIIPSSFSGGSKNSAASYHQTVLLSQGRFARWNFSLALIYVVVNTLKIPTLLSVYSKV